MVQETNTNPETKAVTTIQTQMVFEFESNKIRVILNEAGEPLWVAKDVCDFLGYANHNDVVKRLCRQDGVWNPYLIDALGRHQGTLCIDEGNLYRLIIKSNKPESEPFEAWVCDEVIPTIRKTGGYALDQNLGQSLSMMAGRLASLEQKLDQFQVARIKADLESSPLKLFIQVRCTVRPDALIMKKELYQAYEAYSMKHGIDPMNPPRFFLSLYRAVSSVRSAKRSIGSTRIPCVSGIRLNREVAHA